MSEFAPQRTLAILATVAAINQTTADIDRKELMVGIVF